MIDPTVQVPNYQTPPKGEFHVDGILSLLCVIVYETNTFEPLFLQSKQTFFLLKLDVLFDFYTNNKSAKIQRMIKIRIVVCTKI